jgi:hypothetical protein
MFGPNQSSRLSCVIKTFFQIFPKPAKPRQNRAKQIKGKGLDWLVRNERYQRVARTLGQKIFSPALPPSAFASQTAIQPGDQRKLP